MVCTPSLLDHRTQIISHVRTARENQIQGWEFPLRAAAYL